MAGRKATAGIGKIPLRRGQSGTCTRKGSSNSRVVRRRTACAVSWGGLQTLHSYGWVSVAKSCLTLSWPMDCSPPGSSVWGFHRQEYWSRLSFPSPGDLPEQAIIPFSRGSSGAGYHSLLQGIFRPRGVNPRLLHWQPDSFPLSRQGSTTHLSSVQSLSRVLLFATPGTAARQASLSITNSWSLLRLKSIKSVMPSNHLILCHPFLLLPSIFPSIRVFSNELVLCIRWPKYWSFWFSISPSSEYSGLISFRMDWLDLLAVQGIFKSLLQHHSSKTINS